MPKDHPKTIDRHLLDRCLSADRDAAEEFVREFSNVVYGSVQFTLKSKNVPFVPQDLEDLHQEVFLRLFENRCRKLGQFEGKNGCSLKTWLRIVTVRIVLNHLRKNKIGSLGSQQFSLSLDQIPELWDNVELLPEQLDMKERLQLLQRGVEQLSDSEKQVFRLSLVQGLSAKTIAADMNLSTQNVYTIKHRAVKKLKQYVSR